MQQHLFPPRIARIAGAQLAGALLPSYEVGGDWFDFVENRDGAWLAVADAAGTGPTAAGLGASALELCVPPAAAATIWSMPLGTKRNRQGFTVTTRQLRSGERLVLVTDGVIDRRVESGGRFGTDGIKRALEQATSATAASTAMAIQQAVTECWREPLEDNATIVVMAID